MSNIVLSNNTQGNQAQACVQTSELTLTVTALFMTDRFVHRNLFNAEPRPMFQSNNTYF